jgi:hypothetical protein
MIVLLKGGWQREWGGARQREEEVPTVHEQKRWFQQTPRFYSLK